MSGTFLMKYGLRGISIALVAIAAIGCGAPTPNTEESTATSETTTSETTTTVAEEPNTSSTDPQNTPDPEPAVDSTVDLDAIFGGTQDGWLPILLEEKQLVHTMGPEEVGQIYPGAETLSGEEGDEFRFAESAESDVPGVQGYKFSFQNNTLYSVTIIFDPKLNGDDFFKALTETTIAKYGDVDPEQLEDKYLIWVGPGFASATLSEGFSEFEGNEFNIVLQD